MNRLAFPVLPLLVAILVGCGGKTKTGKTNGGNGKETKKPLKEKVVGTWKATIEMDDEKLKKMLAAQKVPPEKMDEALKKTKSDMPAMSMEVVVNADGTFVRTDTGMGPKPKETKGKWEVASEEGNVLKLKTTDEGDEKSDTIVLTFKGDDEYDFEVDDPKFKEAPFKIPITFKRVK